MAFTIGTDFSNAIQWNLRLDKELPFLRAWLRSWNARRVLDLGCGTGQHCLGLAEFGFDMTGVDNSPEMLREARELTQGNSRCRFLEGDLRHPGAVGAQDAVLCLGNSLCLLDKLADVEQALSAARDCLHARGGLILHVLNYMKFRDPARAFFPLKTDLESGRPLRHFLKMIELQSEHAWVHLVRIEEQNGAWTRTVRSDRLLQLDSLQLRSLLLKVGFGEIQAYGSLQGESYQASSHDLVLCCRRV